MITCCYEIQMFPGEKNGVIRKPAGTLPNLTGKGNDEHMASDTTGKTEKTRVNAGGSATASGIKFQAAVTAIAGVHLIKGSPLGWLDGLVDDTPVAVWAETGGPGDDIKLELRDKFIVEVQVRRGLQSSNKLWDSLMSLAHAVNQEQISYGVLAVSPDSARTVAYKLSQDILRLADGRTDGLRSLAQTFRSKLETAGLPPQAICEKLRIQVVHALDSDGESISAAKAWLNSLVSDQQDVNAAWNRLYREADAIMERKGRWKASAILRMFAAEGIEIADSNSPGAVLVRLKDWVTDTKGSFFLPGVGEPLSINEAWLPLKILARDFNSEPESEAAEAIACYHAVGQNRTASDDSKTSDAEWVGRFYTRAVLIGGPGSGKSTLLTKIAHLYAKDGFPVLKVRLSALAARMESGHTFTDSIFHLGLDGSGISPDDAMKTAFPDWVLLCDGLDECHNQQEAVAEGLQRFASGHTQARIIVTTRPIGYSTTEIADWRHYELLPPDPSSDSEHLANLIRAVVPTTSEIHRNAPDIAAAELKKCASPQVISRSPLLLGMAASLLANGDGLGASKTELYQNLFARIEKTPNSRSVRQHISRPVLTGMLDVLGWALVTSPLDSETTILKHCAGRLEAELGEPRLKTLEITADCLHHWENAGLVEKVYHGSEVLLTFIHKTFAEFAAARYLLDLTPPKKRREEIANRLDDPAWAEVLGFASGMRLAEVIVSEAATGGKDGTIGRLELALSILADPGTSIPTDLCQKIVGLAFNYIDGTQTDDVFSLGCALAEVAKTYPDLLGRAAASRLQSPWFPTRLTAWACAVEAGAEYYDLDAASSAIHSLAAELGKGSASFLSDEPVLLSREILLRGRKDRELLQRFALTFVRRILDIWPSETAGKHVMEIFKIESLNTLGFHGDLAELCKSKGQEFEFQTTMASESAKFMETVQTDRSKYNRAACVAFRAVFSNLVPREGAADDVDLEQSPPLQLSAFLEIIGYGHVPASNVWVWTKPYDSETVREVLRAMVEISAVDEPVLAAEAKAMLNRMDEQPEIRLHRVLLSKVSVDVPPPEWSAVKVLKIDRTKLERALGHESVWLVQAAANLLSVLGGTTEEKAKELLDTGRGYGLAAAAHLTLELEPATATELLLNRIEGLDTPGKHYLISNLNQLNPPWDERLAVVIQTGLISSDIELAEESASLVLKYAESDVPIPPELLNEAFKHWITHEKPYPQNGGVVPYSPRATLLKGMLKLGTIDDERLMNLCRDTRRDVRKIATEALLERVAVSDSVRTTFVNETTAKALPASLLSRALVAKVSFSKIEVGRLSALLEDEDAKWRLAACMLLNPIYLESDVIRQTAEKLSVDPHPEIRQAAARALNHAQALLK